MPDNRSKRFTSAIELDTYHKEFNSNNKNNFRVIRKFINSAIYVEKPINNMPPLRKTSPINLPEVEENQRFCTSNPELTHHNIDKEDPESGYRTSDNSSNPNSSNSDSESQVTIKMVESNQSRSNFSEFRLGSLSSLNTDSINGRTSRIDPKEREEIVRKWLEKKESQMKKKAIEEAHAKEEKEQQRQRLLEKERENFRRWLAEKKEEEVLRRRDKEKEAEEKKLKEAMKEKRQVENDISYQIWLRNKKKLELERRIKEKLTLLQVYQEKQERMEENERAYKEWLRSAKDKPKPIPPNQGLKSLCSSLSVTYINPMPWHPNIELSQKPISQ